MNYSDALEFLNENFISFQTQGRKAYHEGLQTIEAMCKLLENPQRNYITIHIAGTNGKGSVAHILASVLQAAGYRTGLYTSPHLHDFNERIRVDGEPISQMGIANFVADYGSQMQKLGLSYFEMTTAMAFEWFSKSGVEVAIIETGLGGRLDATNIIKPTLSIITNIGLDHKDILGDTIAKIAGEKAGIIKPGVPVVIGQSNPESDSVFIATANKNGSKIYFADKTYECIEKSTHSPWQRFTLSSIKDGRTQDIDLDLQGDFQRNNIITARTAISILRHHTLLNISTRALLTGCRSVSESTGLKGRWQIISQEPTTIADGGHNAHGISEIVKQLQGEKYKKLYIILGFSEDKDIEEILPLMPKEAYYIFTQANSHRAMQAELLAALAAEYGLNGESSPTLAAAVEKARKLATSEDMIFIGGSLYLVSEII